MNAPPRLIQPHPKPASQQRAFQARLIRLRRGENRLLRWGSLPRKMRDRVHVPPVLGEQQQAKYGEKDGTSHSQELNAGGVRLPIRM